MSSEQALELEQVDLFHNLTPATLEWVRRNTHRTEYPASTMVVSAEQPGNIVYFILAGSVKVQLDEMHGSSAILAILGPGDAVGEISLLDGIGRSANVITLAPSTLVWMDGQVFQECLHTLPAFNQNMLRHLCRRLRQANERNLALSVLDLRGRLVHQLLEFAASYGEQRQDGSVVIPLRLTQSDLAALVGGSRERVNRTLQSARHLAYLSIGDDSFITIHDLTALAQWAQLTQLSGPQGPQSGDKTRSASPHKAAPRPAVTSVTASQWQASLRAIALSATL